MRWEQFETNESERGGYRVRARWERILGSLDIHVHTEKEFMRHDVIMTSSPNDATPPQAIDNHARRACSRFQV